MLKKIILLLALLLPCLTQAEELPTLQEYLKDFRTQTVWPVKGTLLDDIISPFGPRNTISSGYYDWHYGLDIKAAEGTEVYAVAPGTVYQKTVFSGGGNSIVLEHEFTEPVLFHDKEITTYYTWYLHLSDFAQDLEEGQEVKSGQLIGYVGQTGNASTPHLHLEFRIGSPWDLETQLSCRGCWFDVGFDPAVNPLFLFPPQAKSMSLELLQAPTSQQDAQIRYVTSDDQPMYNKVQFYIRDTNTKKKKKDYILNLNLRRGFDATSSENMDTPNITKPYLSPLACSLYGDSYSMDIVIPNKYIKKYLSSQYKRVLVIWDIWGRKKKINL